MQQQEAVNVQKQYLADQKREEQQQKELSDLVKTVRTTGVQQQDVGEMSQKLEQVYDTYYKANQAKTQQERLTLKMQLQQQLGEVQQFVGTSKQRGVDQVKIAEYIGNPQNAGLVSPEAMAKFKQYANQPTSKIGANAFSREAYIQPDTSYLDKTEDALVKSLWSGASASSVDNKTLSGNRYNISKVKTTKIKPEDVGIALFDLYDKDTRYKNLINLQAEQTGIPANQLLAQKAQLLVKANAPKVETTTGVQDIRPRAPKSSDGGGTGGFVVEDSLDINYGDKGTVTAREYVSIPTSPTISAGKFAMQDANGNKYNGSNTTEEMKLVSVGTFPVMKVDGKAGNKTIPKGSLATKDFANKNPNAVEYVKKAVVNIKSNRGNNSSRTTTYFADPNEVISRTKLTKAQKEALGAFEQTARSRSGSKPNPTPKPAKQKTAEDYIKQYSTNK